MPVNILDAALGAVAAFAVPVAALGIHSLPAREAGFPTAETVAIPDTIIDFPQPGEFLRDGHPLAAPVQSETVPSFRIMRRLVGLADYERCVTAGACDPAANASVADVPVTGVSWLDAQAYSRWYSEETGEDWRLPTALEAAVAAGERFVGEGVSPVADDPANPAVRWIRRYREEAAAKRPPDPEPKPRGHYGANTNGIEDFGGNVWEWTSTCYERVSVDFEGAVIGSIENCGVHVLEGRHRAYMSDFVRDGKSGGCAVGTPPENLGFRLIKDETPLFSFRRMQKLLAAIPFFQHDAG